MRSSMMLHIKNTKLDEENIVNVNIILNNKMV